MIPANRYIAVLMIIGMLLQINVVLGCYGLYFLNRKAISETVCEKKVRDCCGHCFLRKKIAAATEEPSVPTEKNHSSKNLQEVLDAMPGMLPSQVASSLKISRTRSYDSLKPRFLLDGVAGKIDHPPNA
ncbi:MAG: hypothetical protein HGB20_00335 [Chlorobiaceae bacterium]|nr:hypothetical protein [Chlorobiaceae bacterium]